MTNVVDKLFEVIANCFFFFVPFVVIRHYERGVLLRFGKKLRVIEPGFHWCRPFNIDEALKDNVAPRTFRLVANLTTIDGRAVTVAIVVTCRIRDIEKALLEVENMDNALRDSCHGVLFRYVTSHSWDYLREVQGTGNENDEDDTGPEELYKGCRRRAFRWGVEVMRVQLSDLAVSRSIRLIADEPLIPTHAE